MSKLASTFHDEHERTYGHKATNEPIEIVNLRLTAVGRSSQITPRYPSSQTARDTQKEERQAFFGAEHGLLSTPVIGREDLSENPAMGPLIIEEYDATAVVPPRSSTSLDSSNNIIIEVGDFY